MEGADIETFRERLLHLKAGLEGLAAASREAARPVELDQSSVGRLSRMDAMQAQAMAQEADRRRRRQLAAIEGALRRIDSGDFGLCFACGADIDVRRLAADPTTTRCIACMDLA